ncbi:GrpB family protein [Catellatospora sichuanensis]|uniref:GrpB family protein n=1 Tax=Catellatospora sichuanensis TaxID=1969805 RepID=UPI001C92A31D|nr:GrpB family protein [Catellatospora sichuanensis]
MIVDYDSAWPAMAEAAMTELRAALPRVILEIEHIGSTAVPGLAAKPVIDLMAAVTSLDCVDDAAVERLGYRRHHNGMEDRLLYVRERDEHRTHILHVVTLESWPTRNQRILRDHLRRHSADAERYARLKREIAGLPGYSGHKTALVQELTDLARAERGLPSVPVWEKGR